MATTETYKRWTDTEVEFLRENYATYSIEEIAAHLGRTYDSVAEKAGRIGLRKRAKRKTANEQA